MSETNIQRDTIFISHATPDDNAFTQWLALKLIGLGYKVWCDIFELEKGVDFWQSIDKQIRTRTRKFLFVVSKVSNQRDGALKELAVAQKIKKDICDDTFIYPLMIDSTLSYDDLNIELVRLNAIDFVCSWSSGLHELVNSLKKQNVIPTKNNYSEAYELFEKIELQNKGTKKREEVYDSNWFSIERIPEILYFYPLNVRISSKEKINFKIPSTIYKKHFCSFAEKNCCPDEIQAIIGSSSEPIKIQTYEVIESNYGDEFILNSTCRHLIIEIINKSFEMTLKKTNGINPYQMSNSLAFWIPQGILNKDKIGRIQLIGKQKDKKWHFGISAFAKLYPSPILQIKSHIFFTSDGINLISSNSIQHSARRAQGKRWWNNDWRNRLVAFLQYLSNNSNTFYLETGDPQSKISVSSIPVKFFGNISYDIPVGNNLQEEIELLTFEDLEDDSVDE